MIKDYNSLVDTEFSSNSKGNEAIFMIENEISINNIEKLFHDIQNNMESCSSFRFQLKVIENIDITAVQLFYSFIEKMKEMNKTVRFEIDLTDNAKKILIYSGFTEFTSNSNY